MQPSVGVAARRAVRVVQIISLVLVAAFAVTTLPGVRSTGGFHTLLDGWLQGTSYVVLGVVAVLRPILSSVNRLLWSLVAAAMVLRALGFVVYLSFVRTMSPPPYPSVADAAWLGMAVVLIVALVVLVRARLRRRSVGLVFDALLAGLTAAGIAVELLFRTLEGITQGSDPDTIIATNLAYPILDVVLLVLAAGALVAVGWRSRSTLLLMLGVVGFAVVDSTFVYQVAAGSYRPGTFVAALSLAATAGIAFAGWVPEADLELPVADPEFSRVTFSAGLRLLCVAALVYGAVRDVPLGGILLPAAALVVGIGQAVFTVVMDRGTARVAIGEKNAELLRFKALVETTDDFVAMASPDGTVLYVNPAGRRLVGLAADRDPGSMTIVDFLTEEGVRASLEVEQPAVVAHGRWVGQSTLRDQRGGPPIPVSISSFLMQDPRTGEPVALATVQRDISERLAAQRELQRLADEREGLLGRLVQAQEDERARIAADVHDDSVQALAAVELRLGLLRSQVGAQDPELALTAQAVSESVSHAIDRLRHLLFDLESPAVENDLARALGLAAEHVLEGRVGWRVGGQVDVDLPETLRVAAYRIVREALVNVAKHADAREVVIDLRRAHDGLEVTVDDDGRGVDTSTVSSRPGHLGIAGMQDRAAVVGGTLTVEPRAQGGTRVRLWLPLFDPHGSARPSGGGPEGSA